jgi:transposase
MDFRGQGYPMIVVQEAKNLLELKKNYPNNHNLSYTGIANLVGVKSHITIANWDSLPMDDLSILQRKLEKGHNRKFSDLEELIIAGWVISENKQHNPTRTYELIEFIMKYFFVHVSSSWVSRFQDRQHLSRTLPSKILEYESKPNALETLVNYMYIIQLRKKLTGKKPNQVRISVRTSLVLFTIYFYFKPTS